MDGENERQADMATMLMMDIHDYAEVARDPAYPTSIRLMAQEVSDALTRVMRDHPEIQKHLPTPDAEDP